MKNGLQVNDCVKVKIDAVAFGGEGVGRVKNIVVFVAFSAPGDELEIKIVQVKKRFARGKILKIIRHSPWRTSPLCKYYERCGGCCYQHIDYEYQLQIKKKQVQDIFCKIGKINNPPVLDTVASPQKYHYRGKAQLHTEVSSHGVKIGFLDISGSEIVDIGHCEIMEETINEQVEMLRERKNLIPRGNSLTLWSESSSEKFTGSEVITRIVQGKDFLVPRKGFFQANLYLTDKLVEEVCCFVSSGKVKTLIDAYCGCGFFAVFLSPYAKNIVGIEKDEKSITYARINAGKLSVTNAKFICGNVDWVFKSKFLCLDEKIDLIVLDPPRGGCEKETLKTMVDLRPSKIIYISCNPSTQARDVKFLIERGYGLKSLLPLDMFPQTQHIEVIGLLEC